MLSLHGFNARPPGWLPTAGEVYLCLLDKERPAIILPNRALDLPPEISTN
jgi:hypothetical protein